MRFTSVVLCAALLHTGPAGASVLEIFLAPRPQAETYSCQSYGLALAIGSLAGSPYPVSTVDELRKSELEIRKRIESIAEARVGAIADPAEKRKAIQRESLAHDVWQEAVKGATSGQFQLHIRDVRGLEAFYATVEKMTGVANAGTSTFLNTALVGTPVMTSLTSVGPDTYPGGHIVTVYGVSAANPVASETRDLLLLNPAIKQQNAPAGFRVCDPAAPPPTAPMPGDQKYHAQVWLEGDYQLKAFGGSDTYKVMWIAPTPPARKSEGKKAGALRKELFVAQFVEAAIVDPDVAVTAAKAFVGLDPAGPLPPVSVTATGPSPARLALGVGESRVEQAALDVLLEAATIDVRVSGSDIDAHRLRRSVLRASSDSLRDLAGAAFETINYPVGKAGTERRDRLESAFETLDPGALPIATAPLDVLVGSIAGTIDAGDVSARLREMPEADYRALLNDDAAFASLVVEGLGGEDAVGLRVGQAFGFAADVDIKATTVIESVSALGNLSDRLAGQEPLDLDAATMQGSGQAVAALVGVFDARLGRDVAKGVETAIAVSTAASDLANGIGAAATGNYVGAAVALMGLAGSGAPDPGAARHAEVMAALGRIENKIDLLHDKVDAIDRKLDLVRSDIREIRSENAENARVVALRLDRLQRSIYDTQDMIRQSALQLIEGLTDLEVRRCENDFPAFATAAPETVDIARAGNPLVKCLSVYETLALDTSKKSIANGSLGITSLADPALVSAIRTAIHENDGDIGPMLGVMPMVVKALGLESAIDGALRQALDPNAIVGRRWSDVIAVNADMWGFGVGEYARLVQRVPDFPFERHGSTAGHIEKLAQPGLALEAMAAEFAAKGADVVAFEKYQAAATALIMKLSESAASFVEDNKPAVSVLLGFRQICAGCTPDETFAERVRVGRELDVVERKVSGNVTYRGEVHTCGRLFGAYFAQPAKMVRITEHRLRGDGKLLSKQTVTTNDKRERKPALPEQFRFTGAGTIRVPVTSCDSRPAATIILPLQKDEGKAKARAADYADLRNSLTADPTNAPDWFEYSYERIDRPEHRRLLEAAIEQGTERKLKEFLDSIAASASQTYAVEIADLNAAWVALQLVARTQRGACLAENRPYARRLDAAPTGDDFIELLTDPAPLATLQRLTSGFAMDGPAQLADSAPYVRFADRPLDEIQKKALNRYGRTFRQAARPSAWGRCAPGLSSVHDGLAWLDGLTAVRQIVSQ